MVSSSLADWLPQCFHLCLYYFRKSNVTIGFGLAIYRVCDQALLRIHFNCHQISLGNLKLMPTRLGGFGCRGLADRYKCCYLFGVWVKHTKLKYID